ncbi:hypothetical protein MRB53_040560 [Persea americana]|nr:hypothetical protein MRB53_040560 [Persea americana]
MQELERLFDAPLDLSIPMPALETSKRKFHQLLDNLTKTSAPTTITDPASKRLRIEARSRLSDRVPSSTSALTSAIIAASRNRATISPTVAETPKPGPWSQERFLERLKTFADLTLWTSKPDAINEVQWAKRGWSCVGVNTVACREHCNHRLVVGLRPPRKDAEGKAIEGSEDYSVSIDDIQRLSIARPSIWQTQLRDRYQSFSATSEDLPSASNVSHPFDGAILAEHLPSGVLQQPHEAAGTSTAPSGTVGDLMSKQLSEKQLVSLTFALLGWRCLSPTSTTKSAPLIATCDACFRRLGLWLYVPPAASISPAPESQPTLPPLDLVSNHRSYCPWINADSQASPESLAGLPAWQVLVRNIEAGVDINRTSSLATLDSERVASRASRNSVRIVTSTGDAQLDDPADAGASGTAIDAGARPPDALEAGSTTEQFVADAGTSSQDMTAEQRKAQRETLKQEDRARFKRLRELSSLMGLGKKKRVAEAT